MLHWLSTDFVPDIQGLSHSGYIQFCKTLQNAGFLSGFSIQSEKVVVGFTTSCGLTRLINLDDETVIRACTESTPLFRVLAHQELLNGSNAQNVRSWFYRPSSVRCSALAALVSAGVVLDRNLHSSFGTISDDENHILCLKAIHDTKLRSALGNAFHLWAQKHVRKNIELPDALDNEDFEWKTGLNLHPFTQFDCSENDLIDTPGGLN